SVKRITTGLFVAALAMPHAAGAQPIALRGFADIAGTGGLTFVGNRGFTYTQGLAFSDNLPGVFNCNGDPAHCVPGATANLRASGREGSGTATLDGATYTDVGGAASNNSVVLDFEGSAVLPPIAPTATVTAPFTFQGQFMHPAPGTSMQVTDAL